MHPRWTAYVVRMTLAAIFLAAGLDHVAHGLGSSVRFLPASDAFGALLAWGELLAGLGLALGGLFPLSAGVAGFVALAAPIVVLLGDGAFVSWDFAMAGGAVFLLAHGPGPASADAWLVARRPALARWLQPWRGARAERAGVLALRGGLAFGLLGVTLFAVAQGTWTSASPARIAPVLGTLAFVARAAAGALVALRAQTRFAGALAAAVGVLGIAALPFEYHPYILVGLGAVLLLAPEQFTPTRAGAPLAPSQLARAAEP